MNYLPRSHVPEGVGNPEKSFPFPRSRREWREPEWNYRMITAGYPFPFPRSQNTGNACKPLKFLYVSAFPAFPLREGKLRE